MKPEAKKRLAEAMRFAIAGGYRDDERGFPPGRFECEPFYVAYYYNAMLDGFADEPVYDGETCIGDLFTIDADSPEREAFDLAPDTVAVMLTYSDVGFVGVVELDECELDAVLTDSIESQESET